MQTSVQDGRLGLVLRNDVSELESCQDAVRAFLEQRDVSKRGLYSAQLIFEERIMNTIQYGYSDRSTHQIRVSVAIDGDDIVMLFEDDGHGFDPLAAPNLSRAKNLDEATVGGRGLFLMRKMAKKLDYQRQEGLNKLRVSVSR